MAHFAADTITYVEPINPQSSTKPIIEPLAIHIFCTHHQTYNIGTTDQLETLKTIIKNLQITQYHIQKAPPTPYNTIVNKNTKWNKLLYPPHTNQPTTQTPPIPTYEINTTLKFPPQYSYYTDGSFIPPKQAENRRWKKEKAGYGIYNPMKDEVKISKRLPGLQTCFRAELMAIHKTLRLITTKYINEPARIFTDCLNYIYVLNTHIKHPTQHNNHADKAILTSMVDMLKKCIQPTTISKVKAHTNIVGNEQVDILAKSGAKKRYRFAIKTFEFAHTTPFFFQKDIWPGLNKRPDKGPVRCLQTYITKHDRETNLKIMAEQFSNISKWTMNPDIDNDISNKFWSTPTITNSQKTSILKFRTGQYMGNARKQLFFWHRKIPNNNLPNMQLLGSRYMATCTLKM
jgi:ribonuclease HI